MEDNKVLDLVDKKHFEQHGDLSEGVWRQSPEFSGVDTELYAIGSTDHYTLSHMIYYMPESALRYSVLALGEKVRELEAQLKEVHSAAESEKAMLRDNIEILNAKIKQ